jgi:hypothetical protein
MSPAVPHQHAMPASPPAPAAPRQTPASPPRYFILLNSSIKGPFSPSYMPANWHWTHAYMARFTADIHAVSSSLVCLPEADAGEQQQLP